MFYQIFGELNEISYKFQKNFGQNVKKIKKNVEKFEANFEKFKKKRTSKFTKQYQQNFFLIAKNIDNLNVLRCIYIPVGDTRFPTFFVFGARNKCWRQFF